MNTLVTPQHWTPETSPIEVIEWALKAHPDVVMPSAFNLNGIVLIDLAVRAGYSNAVVFVDTDYHFPETLQTRDALIARYPKLRFVTLSANLALDNLFQTDTDACCAQRKVAPLNQYLSQKCPSALLNARSRDQSSTRSTIEFVELGADRTRIHPLAHWDRATLELYAHEHHLNVNPLYWDGFLSIGCAPCTRAVRPGEDARAGRWSGSAKLECGLWQGDKAI